MCEQHDQLNTLQATWQDPIFKPKLDWEWLYNEKVKGSRDQQLYIRLYCDEILSHNKYASGGNIEQGTRRRYYEAKAAEAPLSCRTVDTETKDNDLKSGSVTSSLGELGSDKTENGNQEDRKGGQTTMTDLSSRGLR